jgi:hypothetical protein
MLVEYFQSTICIKACCTYVRLRGELMMMDIVVAALDWSNITTGNACFAEGLSLCREPNLGHSAKTLFAEG